MMRDPGTIAMMFAMPVIQLVIFGYAINGDPRHLPLAVESMDNSAFSRSIVSALRNTTYFDVEEAVGSYGQADRLVALGKVQFAISIPPDFSRNLVRGQRPQLLVIADATDPSATGPALGVVNEVVEEALLHDLIGPLDQHVVALSPVDIVIHRSYNPEGITSHNTVPGLLAIILSISMVTLTAMSVIREREQGTMENLLATPLRPIEVMIGKIVPHLIIGSVQTAVVLAFASILFHVPFVGSLALIVCATLLFILVSLTLGLALSTIAQSQLQVTQLGFFYMLPSILLSGFVFPFRGMPIWAQGLSELLPATHFIWLIRGIMLKGWTFADSLPQLLVLLLMLLLLSTVTLRRYQDTII